MQSGRDNIRGWDVGNIINIEEVRDQRQRRLHQQQIVAIGQQAAAAFLAHLEATARGAAQEAVDHRRRAVEEYAGAYQELLQTSETAPHGELDDELLAQIDGEFEADWLEHLRDECAPPAPAELDDAPSAAAHEPGVQLACQLAYRRGYAAGLLNATRRDAAERDE